jgi:hypothetical protein
MEFTAKLLGALLVPIGSLDALLIPVGPFAPAPVKFSSLVKAYWRAAAKWKNFSASLKYIFACSKKPVGVYVRTF